MQSDSRLLVGWSVGLIVPLSLFSKKTGKLHNRAPIGALVLLLHSENKRRDTLAVKNGIFLTPPLLPEL